ncbi:MAG: hypothetical protein JXO44_06030 [Clostridia bacterium]|nr:hypothetical protein [Clostridia bacterium]
MKKLMTLALAAILVVSLITAPTFAAKPENPGNSNKTESSSKADKEKTEKEDKEDKSNNDNKVKVTIEDDTVEVDTDDADDTEGDDEEKVVVEDEETTSDKVGTFLEKWQKRYEEYNGEDTDEDANDSGDGKGKKPFDEKSTLPWGLEKRDGDLPAGLAKKEELPYGLLKRIEPDAIPKGQIIDEITGEEIDIETLLADSAELLDSAVEGDELGQYFDGSIEKYDAALTTYTNLVNAGESTEEELQAAAETLNDAYNTFIMSRTATLDELKDYNSFLDEVDEILDDVEIGTEEGQITAENYDALIAYFDTLEPFDVITDEEEGLTPDKVSIEAMITLLDNATEKFDELMGYNDDTTEESDTESDTE